MQVKNGPIDFQPREPFHPLFGAMPASALGLEVQISKEYLGFNTHFAYLGTMWEEVLCADTFRPGRGATVARVVDGSLNDRPQSLIAGVANTGTDRNWSGSDFDQANWYAFGRLAWNPMLSARMITTEWTRMTWSNDAAVVAPITRTMMSSRQAVVDYMTPLGLAHLMGTSHHYGPASWVANQARPEWNPTYYHRANRNGIGFDRTPSGSDAVAQYAPILARRWSNPATTGDHYLLWFHHLGWNTRMPSGRTLWTELVRRYDRGMEQVAAMRRQWDQISQRLDPERSRAVALKLETQEKEARWWRDASIAYFQSVSGRPLPPGTKAPKHALSWHQALRFPDAPGQAR